MNNATGTVLDDGVVAPEEFRSGADFSKSHDEAMKSGDVRKVGFGGMIREEDATKPAAEATMETERERLSNAPAMPALPWWISEKYHWTQGQSGGFYLKPFDEYLAYVIEKAPKAANAGIGVVFPNGEHDKTQEAAIVTGAIPEVIALRESLKALNELEASSFSKFLIERCLRNAVYAATTQFELVNWAQREAARNNDVSLNENYGEKVSRKLTFMRTAGALYALIREAFPDADLGIAAFERMAKRVIYDTARIEADRLKNPAQLTQEQKSGTEAARLVAEDF